MSIDSNVIISGSTLSPTGVNHDNCPVANSGQKWWVSVVFGFLFLVIASPIFVWIILAILKGLGAQGNYAESLVVLLIQTIIFIVLIRLILN